MVVLLDQLFYQSNYLSMPFINQWVIIPVSKSKSESLRTFKYEVSVFGSCLVCIVQSQAAFSYKDNKNLRRKQGVSQASVVKVGQPAELGSWSPCFVLFCFFSTALLVIPLVIYNINFYKITEIVRVIWLVKNLWFIIPVNP